MPTFAAVKSKRNLGLAQHLHGSARQPEVFAVEHVEDLGQARILIAAHGGINHVIGNDARLIVMISDAAKRAFRQSACVRSA
jgi:hypothetical protein